MVFQVRRFTKISLSTLNHVVSWFLPKDWHYCRITGVFKRTVKLSAAFNQYVRFISVFRTLSNIYDGAFCRNSWMNCLSVFYYFVVLVFKRSTDFKVPNTLLQIGRSGTATTSKVELFVIIVNDWKSLTIIAKSSTLDVVAVLFPPLDRSGKSDRSKCFTYCSRALLVIFFHWE